MLQLQDRLAEPIDVLTFLVLDEKVTKDIFARVLELAGSLVGIGRFRPQNRGYYGRFQVNSMEWVEQA